MMDIKRQIEYWRKGANDDLDTARILIERGRMVHGLFFCHLVIEKVLKALVVKQTSELAPRSHNLIHLAELANLSLLEDDEIFLGILMKYQLQGRYPDYNPAIPEQVTVLNYLDKTEKLLLWLMEKSSNY
jgi:HEPN domain-containing protein